MKTQQELKTDIALNEMLKKFPGVENFYVANKKKIQGTHYKTDVSLLCAVLPNCTLKF